MTHSLIVNNLNVMPQMLVVPSVAMCRGVCYKYSVALDQSVCSWMVNAELLEDSVCKQIKIMTW